MNTMTDLSETEIAAMIAAAQQEIKARQAAKRGEVEAKINELAKSIGCTAKLSSVDLAPAKTATSQQSRAKPVAKYRDPANPKNSWSGRGQLPKWMREHVNQGRSVSDFRV